MKITIDFKDPKTEKPNPKSQFEYFKIVIDEPRTDAEKSIDDIFNDIIGGSDV